MNGKEMYNLRIMANKMARKNRIKNKTFNILQNRKPVPLFLIIFYGF